MSEPELESIRIIGGQPTIIIAFETHQVRHVVTSPWTPRHLPLDATLAATPQP